MEKVKYLFVVLVYRNVDDLQELILSIQKQHINNRIIIVNSYYDEASKLECEKISLAFNCNFINVENKGYGYGNNRGIEFANKHYEYEYIIISNPDIVIKKFHEKEFLKIRNGVVGPIINTANNKSQNPYWILNNKFSEWLIYKGYKEKSMAILYFGIAINKILREIFLIIFKFSHKIDFKVHALHGSFVIFPYMVLKKIGLPYDEEMFLFAEEAHLANLLDKHNIASYISKSIAVLHKEDGSITIANINEMSELRKSVMTYYEKWFLTSNNK